MAGYIAKITGVKKHSNADRLQVGNCFGNQVIVGLDTNENDIGVYFPTDMQLGEKYCEVNNLVRKKDENGKEVGGYLDPKKRNIRAMKLRGEISDGLFMPLETLKEFTDIDKLKDGELISVLNGETICQKYIPLVKKQYATTSNSKPKDKKPKNKTEYPIFAEHVDTKQLAYCSNELNQGDICYITLKMHGTSGRTSYSLVKEKKYKTGLNYFISKLFGRLPYTLKEKWDYVCGSRRVILKSFDGGFYGTNKFRQEHHASFLRKLKKGETVYYEIVGYQEGGRPIMGTVSNKKTNDKQFIKKYGENTVYSYGCEDGKSDIYIYRMTMTNEDGDVAEYPWDMVKTRATQMGLKFTPEFDRFIYTTHEDLMERVDKYSDGADPIGKSHIREGIVLRIEGREKFKALKHKNFTFKLLEGIVKNDATEPDIEEAESLQTVE